MTPTDLDETELGVLGTLPTTGRFVSTNCDGAAAQRLAAWIQAGVARASVEALARTDVAFRFVFRSDADHRVLVGRLWPSGDEPGWHLPFALFVRVPASTIDAHEGLFPLAAEPYWDRLGEIYEGLLLVSPPEEQVETLAGHRFGRSEPPDAVRAEFRRRVIEESGTIPDLPLVSREALRFAAALATGRADAPFGARIPLALDMDPALQSAAWLQVIQGRDRRLPAQPTLFERSDAAGASDVYLFRGPVYDTDFDALLSPGQPARGIVEFIPRAVARDDEIADDDRRFHAEFERRWAGRPATLRSLLDLSMEAWRPAAHDPRLSPWAVTSAPPALAGAQDSRTGTSTAKTAAVADSAPAAPRGEGADAHVRRDDLADVASLVSAIGELLGKPMAKGFIHTRTTHAADGTEGVATGATTRVDALCWNRDDGKLETRVLSDDPKDIAVRVAVRNREDAERLLALLKRASRELALRLEAEIGRACAP